MNDKRYPSYNEILNDLDPNSDLYRWYAQHAHPKYSRALYLGLLLGPSLLLALLKARSRKLRKEEYGQRSSYLKELGSTLTSETPYAITSQLGLPYYLGLLGGRTVYKRLKHKQPIHSTLSSEFLKSLPWVGAGLLGTILSADYLDYAARRNPVRLK